MTINNVRNKPRISNAYCPGAGDQGKSKITKYSSQEKNSVVCSFYTSVERLQCVLQRIIIEQTTLKRLEKLPFMTRILKSYSLSALTQDDVFNTIKWLDTYLFSLQAYVYSDGNSTNNECPVEFSNYVNEQTRIWSKLYANSDEFQSFSSHHTLNSLNNIRLEVRAVESAFVNWYSTCFSIDDPLSSSIIRHSSVLNRLSTYFWCATQKERISLELPPVYWHSKAPSFSLSVLHK